VGGPMVRSTKANEVGCRMLAAFGAELEMMHIEISDVPAARDLAPPLIAQHDGAAQRWWNALLGAHAHVSAPTDSSRRDALLGGDAHVSVLLGSGGWLNAGRTFLRQSRSSYGCALVDGSSTIVRMSIVRRTGVQFAELAEMLPVAAGHGDDFRAHRHQCAFRMLPAAAAGRADANHYLVGRTALITWSRKHAAGQLEQRGVIVQLRTIAAPQFLHCIPEQREGLGGHLEAQHVALSR
jgi:hypothetical protein